MNGFISCMILISLLGSSVVYGASGPATIEGWNYEILDTDIKPTAPSIRIDSQGYPHIAYIREDQTSLSRRITYAFYSGASWEFRTVVEDEQLKYCFLALTSNDEPCIVYQSGSHPYTVRYAEMDSGGVWFINDIASSTNTGHLYGIEVGSDDRPHIIYYDVDWNMGEKDSHHIRFDGAWWIDQIVWYFGDSSGCWGISQVMDSQDSPCYAQYNYFAGFSDSRDSWERPVYTEDSGSGWSAMYIGDYNGDETDIALSTTGLPRIVFQDEDQLLYASSDGVAWNITEVDPIRAAGDHCALASDGSDTPPVVYQDSGNDDLRYAWCDGGWNTMLIDSAGEVGVDLDAAVDAEGNPFIAHYDATGHQLRLAWYGDPTGIHGSSPETPEFVSIAGISPNPVTGYLTASISLMGDVPVVLSVYDLGGRLVLTEPCLDCGEGITAWSLDVTGLESGVYLLRVGTPLEGDAILFTVLRGRT